MRMADPVLVATRREILRSYFLDVVRDLVARGVIRKSQGQSYSDILRSETAAVLEGVTEDFAAVAREIGFELGTGLARVVEGAAQRQLSDLIAGGLNRIFSRR